MDKTCAWLQSVIQWVDRQAVPPIHFAGTGTTFGNKPAPFIELVYLREGAIDQLMMGPLTISMSAGQIGLLNVHFGNVANAESRFKGLCVFFDVVDVSAFDVLKDAPLAFVADVSDPDRVERDFFKVIERSRTVAGTPEHYQPVRGLRTQAPTIAGQALLKAAVLELLGNLFEGIRPASSHGPATAAPPGLIRAVEFMRRAYHNPELDREQLAKSAGYQADHFGRSFQQHFKMSPMRYLTQIRIEQACFLLRHTTQRIEEIACQVGFIDPFHFSRVFRRHIGVSPRRYRQTEE